MDRALTDRERAVVEWMLQDDFNGVEALRAQIPGLRVRGMCGCGCPTVDFITEGSGTGDLLPRMGTLPGTAIFITLFAREGELTMLDLTDFVGLTTEYPDPDLLVAAKPN